MAQKPCVGTRVVLEEGEMRENEKVVLSFLRSLGRVVKIKIVEAGEAEQVGGAWSDGC